MRIAVTAAVALLVVLAGGTAASAAESQVVAPRQGETIDGGEHQVRVRVVYGPLEEPVERVRARLARRGGTSDSARLTCVDGCGSSEETWRLRFDANSSEPFSDEPLANGPVEVETAVGGERFETGPEVTLSVPGSPATDVAASSDASDVRVSWTRAPEPDISAYRVERRRGDGSWTSAGEVDADTSRFTDRDRKPGAYDYRVITERPDGEGGTLTTRSSSDSAEVEDPDEESSASPSPDGSPSQGESSSDGDSDGSSGSPSPSGGSGSSDGRDGGDGGGGSGGESARRASAPSVDSSGSSGDGTSVSEAPGPDVAESDEEEFFGEDDAFSGELDFGARTTPESPDDFTETESVRVPGGMATSVERVVDTDRIATSGAAGLLFIATGLHLRQWMRRGRGYLTGE